MPPKFWLPKTVEVELLTVNGLTLHNGKQSAVKATSLIILQFICIQYNTLPTKSYSVFNLVNTNKQTYIVGGQCLPKVHVTSLSGREQRTKRAPSNMTAAKTVTVWGDIFPCSHSQQNLQSRWLSEDELLLFATEQVPLPNRESFAQLALRSFTAARGWACSHPGRPLTSRGKAAETVE